MKSTPEPFQGPLQHLHPSPNPWAGPLTTWIHHSLQRRRRLKRRFPGACQGCKVQFWCPVAPTPGLSKLLLCGRARNLQQGL